MKTKRFRILSLIFFGVISAGFSGNSVASDEEGSPKRWYTEAGIAVQGYDPVAYFTEKKPVKGDVEFSYKWDGVAWLFSSAEHRELFKKDPEQYAPQYGGYCSLGVAYGEKPSGSAEAWTVRNGKLYLNNNKKVRDRWLQDPAKYIRMADEQWPRIKNK